MSALNSQPVALAMVDTISRLKIQVTDANGDAADADNVVFTLLDLENNVLVTDDFSVGGTRIVKPAGTFGQYYFPLGDVAPNNETNTPRELMAKWDIDAPGSASDITVVQAAKVVTVRTMFLVPFLRLLIDKSVKVVDENPANPCFLGYTDSNLVMFLEGGLQIINAYEPYPIFSSLDDFPDTFRHVLLESALISGVMSQELFAIDTDVPNFSDQGNSFVLQHQPQLAAFLNTITQRLDRLIPLMKLKLINNGALHIQAGSNFRLTQLLQASPNGALFRNTFFRS